jgi:hypothetical protein
MTKRINSANPSNEPPLEVAFVCLDKAKRHEKDRKTKTFVFRQNAFWFCLVKIEVKLLINKERNAQQDKRQFFQEYNVPPENNIFFFVVLVACQWFAFCSSFVGIASIECRRYQQPYQHRQIYQN